MQLPERRLPFSMSVTGAGIGAPPLDSSTFRTKLLTLEESELTGYYRSYVRDRVPAAFVEQPMLWEATREWLATRLSVNAFEIGLTGSAQVGFSCAPECYGRKFSARVSDLDLFVVNSAIYAQLSPEVKQFVSAPGQLFGAQRETLKRTLKRSFFDLNQIPNDHSTYRNCSNVNNLTSVLVEKLEHHKMRVRRSHFRVYESWKGFARQTLINLKDLRAKLS